ncbi:hypothetical protein P2P98_03240 [Microbacterium sp. Kw_RZR3]|uniref:hypothetical protein n=1 Tax=Microbacterium sp. Kw_RZR3 TaxID=3032903 RepID=UPI0023DC5204|nr:hypothetical protein [Microbacterium sp. Kw_RZR3]MDF2045164.1 hypothetical protein [Microbacterium sp. Kw_RZR3]
MAARMVIVGRLQVAGATSMALAIRQPTEVQRAVDDRIVPVAAQVIAEDSTIIAGASAAVKTQLAEEEIPTGARQVTPRNRKAAIFAANGRVLLAFNRSDGRIDDESARAVGARIGEVGAVGASLRAWSPRFPWSHVWSQNGRVTLYLDKHTGELMRGDGTPVSSTSTDTLEQFSAGGDSMTWDADLPNPLDGWSAQFTAETGHAFVRRGRPGLRMEEIAWTLGGTSVSTVVTGGVASATFNVTTFAPIQPFRAGAMDPIPVIGMTDDHRTIRGTLIRVNTDEATFIRTDGGPSITTANLRIRAVRPNRDSLLIVGGGTNNIPLIEAGTQTVEQVLQSFRDAVNGHRGPLMIWGPSDRGPSEGPSTARGQAIRAIETGLANEWGAAWTPVRSYLASQQAIDDLPKVSSYTPTSEDLAAIAVNTVPPGFRILNGTNGSVHYSEVGMDLQTYRFVGAAYERALL